MPLCKQVHYTAQSASIPESVKAFLHAQLLETWQRLHTEGSLPEVQEERIEITATRDAKHGDYASNLALALARDADILPRKLAEQIRDALPEHPDIQRIEIAGPGFINFYLNEHAKSEIIDQILEQGDQYGREPAGSRGRVLIEYVSANPTGPLHIGHGRGAALGSCLSRIFAAGGYAVECEYFINDAGRQMDILALSVWLRYLELCGEDFAFPRSAYQGDYILDIAADLHREHQRRWHTGADTLPPPPTSPAGAEKEAKTNANDTHLDLLIEHAHEQISGEDWASIRTTACNTLMKRIERDLEGFGAVFDNWRSERELQNSGQVEAVLAQLEEAGHLYEREGATWFRSSHFGDEKDRVVRRSNGQWTYFATDIAYHAEKLNRGYDTVINIWGADHHGYAARLRGAIEALGENPNRLEVLFVQFATLRRGEEQLPMSTREGEFVTLHALQQEIGRDATRFFYVMRGATQHLDFDLRLATQKSADNPVYYVQYAHARICRLLERAGEGEATSSPCDLSELREPGEQALQKQLAQYPDIVQRAASERSPHHITHYLRNLAGDFHAYYNATTVLVDETGVRQARLRLACAVRQILNNGLELLGINAPESM